MTEHTTKALADEIIAGLAASYDLVYVAYDDRLTDKQVAAVVHADLDSLWEDTDDWESENRYQTVKTIIESDAKDILNRWEREDGEDYSQLLGSFEGSEEWERVREVLEDRDTRDWVKQLISQTPNVLLRINVLDEDHGYAFEDVQPEQVLEAVGLPATDDNKAEMAATLAECSPEFSVLLGYWIVGADVGHLYDLPIEDDTEVEIVNPHLYLGNPFAGSGYISDKPFQGTVRVKRGDLRTDKDTFGYSVTEVYGGLNPSDFTAEIRVAATEEVPDADHR